MTRLMNSFLVTIDHSLAFLKMIHYDPFNIQILEIYRCLIGNYVNESKISDKQIILKEFMPIDCIRV